MAESFIQVPPNSTGSKFRTFNQTVGANSVEHQAFVICDSSGNIIDSINVGGVRALPVTPPGDVAIAQGTITAVQPAPNTPVAGGTVATGVLPAGAASVHVVFGGTFSSGSTIQFEGLMGGSTLWTPISMTFKASSSTTNASSVSGGGYNTYNWEGSCVGYSQIRARSSSFAAGDTITANWTASQQAVQPVRALNTNVNGFSASLPAGANTIGSVDRVKGVGEYMAASFRLAGTATTPINLLTIENTAGSPRRVEIRRIAIDVSVSSFAAAYTLQSYFRLWHRTGVTPTGGTQPAKTSLNITEAASGANVVVRFPASADGTATAITHALPARSPDRAQAHPQFFWSTAAGFAAWYPNDYELHDYAKPPLVLMAGDTLLVAIAGAASSAAFNYGMKVIWEEF